MSPAIQKVWKCRIKCHVLLALVLAVFVENVSCHFKNMESFCLPGKSFRKLDMTGKGTQNCMRMTWLNHGTNTPKSTAHHRFNSSTLKQLILLMGVSHSAEPPLNYDATRSHLHCSRGYHHHQECLPTAHHSNWVLHTKHFEKELSGAKDDGQTS